MGLVRSLLEQTVSFPLAMDAVGGDRCQYQGRGREGGDSTERVDKRIGGYIPEATTRMACGR